MFHCLGETVLGALLAYGYGIHVLVSLLHCNDEFKSTVLVVVLYRTDLIASGHAYSYRYSTVAYLLMEDFKD